jgi:dTDP-glucose 4,6-dehydratase
MSFVQDNVVGTCNALELAHRLEVERFLYFSTDEVFGPAPLGVAFKEDDRYRSGNPYAATKAGGEELAMAYFNTYKLPVIVTHTMNVFGPRQHPEKFIPQTIGKVLRGDVVLIHSDATRTLPGSRHYIHAEDVAEAVVILLERGVSGEKYNLVGPEEVDNLAVARLVAQAVGRVLHYDLVDYHSSRPGHDLRYALDGRKMKERLGWSPKSPFQERLDQTVAFTLQNRHWVES